VASEDEIVGVSLEKESSLSEKESSSSEKESSKM
jgi:hypothetical protein